MERWWEWMDVAPKDGRWVEGERANGERVAVHWAEDMNGSEQPPFRGWFRDAGTRFQQVDDLVAWLPPQPRRIQRKRVKGWRKPPGVVYVGRPSIWGNPYDSIEEFKQAVDDGRLRRHLTDVQGWRLFSGGRTWTDILRPLTGKDLMCWCPLDLLCHADFLLALANGIPLVDVLKRNAIETEDK